MENDTNQNLLEEYRANVQLWMHDDNLRQKRTENLLTTNTILLVALGVLINLNAHANNTAVCCILISFFGLLLSLIWNSILKRNAHYIMFRRIHLKFLEKKLQPMSTFTNTYLAFYENKELVYPEIHQSFLINSRGRKSSTVTEGQLPVIISIFWIVVFIVGIVLLFI